MEGGDRGEKEAGARLPGGGKDKATSWEALPKGKSLVKGGTRTELPIAKGGGRRRGLPSRAVETGGKEPWASCPLFREGRGVVEKFLAARSCSYERGLQRG